MAVETLIHYTCDRCGKRESIPANVGAAPDRPDDWGIWTLEPPRSIPDVGPVVTAHTVAACPDCLTEVNNVIGRKLIHVGHARQSGSGKTWTELGLERQSDPERWVAVYAFRSGPDLPTGVEDKLRADLAYVKEERDKLHREVMGYRNAIGEARKRERDAKAAKLADEVTA